MIAFHGKQETKDTYVARVKAHKELDEIAQGVYFGKDDDGKIQACGVGCTIHSSEHDRYEVELGIPTALAFLEDRIFESMDLEEAKEWPLQFLEVIPVGADLSNVIPLFMAWLMDDPKFGVANITEDAEIKELSLEVARRYRTGEMMDGPEAEALADRLRAAWAARDAWAARAAWAAWAARAAWAAWAARDAWAAWAARDAWAAWAARAAFVKASATELLRLLSEAPVLDKAEKEAA